MAEKLDVPSPFQTPASRPRTLFPPNSSDWETLSGQMEQAKRGDYDWRRGTLPLYVYWASEEAHEVSKKAYQSFFVENGLARKAFPSVQQLERDVIDMVMDLLNAPEGAAGSFTTGGTESIFQAVKAARGYSRSRGRTVKGREKIVVPWSAHPAFDKAASYLDLDVVRVSLGNDFRADLNRLEAEIDPSTILIVGSAPSFPHGIYDNIEGLSRIAQQHDLWLHVDACVGGMLGPFLRELGDDIPTFDFTLPGVSSMSVDLHKYGYASKGASLVLYRSGEMKQHQIFEFANWPRGYYATESFLGTRAGAPVASAWAVMKFLGKTGYLEAARKIFETKKHLIAGINRINGLKVVEPNQLSFFLYRSNDPDLDINAVAERLGEKGWFVGRSVEPSAIHLMINPVHADNADRYLRDLEAVVASVRSDRAVGTLDTKTY
ncbi:aminotransferase class V-fold PLP-dependent enzyme [Hyphomicrobium sp. CS1BSMeth3]|uniref:pyridoxal phosphate-dependent decarboxylase family protein n=1 Tax=Hyphomicrobium sp. CS1BSMeth3 TaxID=1892844 RepID=UPI0009FAEAA9|nr:aminotransferase class V-fold PLP-dependent enzyme [Hyphomicrobium sp. CS1BSMeth3]